VPLDAPHGGGEIAARQDVALPAEGTQPFRRQRFKANEDAGTTSPRGQRQQLLIIGHVDRDLGHPLLAQLRPEQRAKEVLRPGDMLGGCADQIVVHDQDVLFSDRTEFTHHVGDRPLPVTMTVERRHAAEAATERAAPRGLDGPAGIIAGEQVVPRRRNLIHVRMRASVQAL